MRPLYIFVFTETISGWSNLVTNLNWIENETQGLGIFIADFKPTEHPESGGPEAKKTNAGLVNSGSIVATL